MRTIPIRPDMIDPVREPATHPLEARLRAAGCVYAEEEAALLRDAATGSDLDDLVTRRVAGEPLEVLVGWADLEGVRVRTAPGVFVPRADHEGPRPVVFDCAVSA